MKEIFQSLFESTNDRLKNPIIGSFIISWIIFNWRAIAFFFFSNKNIEYKIEHINLNYSNFNNLFLFPIITSLIYITIFPYVLMTLDKLISLAVKTRKNSVKDLIIFDLKNKQKIAEEESELENIKASFRDKKDLNYRIEILTNQIDEKDKIIQTLNDELGLIKKNLPPSNNDIEANLILDSEYQKFKEKSEFDYFPEIAKSINAENQISKNIDRLIIEKFKALDIISEKKENTSGGLRNLFYLTNKGIYYWKKYLLSIDISKVDKNKSDDLPF